MELSLSLKYVKSPGTIEVRRSFLNTPPGKHVLTPEVAEVCTSVQRTTLTKSNPNNSTILSFLILSFSAQYSTLGIY